MNRRLAIALMSISLCGEACGAAQQPATPAAAVTDDFLDRHALSAPADAEKSLDRLAAYLIRPAANERGRARVIFRWLTDRVRFDVDAFYTGARGAVRAEAVLAKREALGEGYAVLFEALARRAGLAAATIAGQAKGMPSQGMVESPKGRGAHVWNAVGIDGTWQLLDAAWGAGFVKGQRFHKFYQEQYFLTPPSQMVLTHMPADHRWQLLAKPLTLPQFDALAPMEVSFIRLGFTTRDFRISDKNRPPEMVTNGTGTRNVQIGSVKVMTAPVGKVLNAQRDCWFLAEAPQAEKMLLRNNERTVELLKVGTRFEGSIWVEPGTLKLLQQVRGRAEPQVVLDYKVAAVGDQGARQRR